MSDVVFILGAGASRHAKAPLMADFLDKAKELLAYGRTRISEQIDKKEHFERVFKAIGALQQVHSKSQLDINNIESIFSIIEMADMLQKFPGIEKGEIPVILKSLKEVIITTLQMSMKFPVVNGAVHGSNVYKSFTDLIQQIKDKERPRRRVSVITFNYDIGVEMAFYRAGIVPQYCLPNEKTGSPVKLLKLHGSLNWAMDKSQGIIPLNMNDYFQKYGVDWGHNEASLLIGSHLHDYFEKHKKVDVESLPVLVPPTWNKTDYQQSITSVWQQAAKELGEAESIFVIGYSLPETDGFFRHLYALGSVGENPLRQFTVFNPDNTGLVKERFEGLLGTGAKARFEYREETFDEAIRHLETLFKV
ncbi:MAG: hypothetical protein JXA82_17860 [Sedimentisphaerales bacterium]|nr:hypothetical protein [Sedimentisphaerales bacterium]